MRDSVRRCPGGMTIAREYATTVVGAPRADGREVLFALLVVLSLCRRTSAVPDDERTGRDVATRDKTHPYAVVVSVTLALCQFHFFLLSALV